MLALCSLCKSKNSLVKAYRLCVEVTRSALYQQKMQNVKQDKNN